MSPDGVQSPVAKTQQQPLTCEELMCEEGSDCIMRQLGGEGEEGGRGGRRRGAICKRKNVDDDPDIDTSREPDSEDRRSNGRQGPSVKSGGRPNNN
jgi:hypothetical protein